MAAGRFAGCEEKIQRLIGGWLFKMIEERNSKEIWPTKNQ
jgi:hypothetical protein